MPRAIGWAPALLPPTGGVIARPSFHPEPWPRRCDREIAENACRPLSQIMRFTNFQRPMNYRFFRPFPFFDHTGNHRARCWSVDERVGQQSRMAGCAEYQECLRRHWPSKICPRSNLVVDNLRHLLWKHRSDCVVVLQSADAEVDTLERGMSDQAFETLRR